MCFVDLISEWMNDLIDAILIRQEKDSQKRKYIKSELSQFSVINLRPGLSIISLVIIKTIIAQCGIQANIAKKNCSAQNG